MMDLVLPMRSRAFNAFNASFNDPAGPGMLKLSRSNSWILLGALSVPLSRFFVGLLIRFYLDS